MNKGIQIYKDLAARSFLIKRDGPFFNKDNSEQMIKEIRQTIPNPEVFPYQNDLHDFGIKKADLRAFNYLDLQDIFYGVHNISLHDLMLMNQNKAEILATYLGLYKIKRNTVKHNGLRNGQHEDTSKAFENIIKEIDREGYQNPIIRGLQHESPNPHSIERGNKQKRFELMPISVKREFVDIFKEDLRKAIHEKYNGDFYDPNCDGHNRSIYTQHIYNYFKERSESNKFNTKEYLDSIID